MNYWLIKSEPEAYSLRDLQRDQETIWDGVRNYQARNYLRQMQTGDLAFFYHSNAAPPGIIGLARVKQTGLVDPSQFDATSKYHDPKATPDQPRWFTVTVEFIQEFPSFISLETLRQHFSPEELGVVRQGNRLSVMPVSLEAAEKILALSKP